MRGHQSFRNPKPSETQSMSSTLLPANFDALLQDAVDTFWATRSKGSSIQGGSRGKVISGKNLDGFLTIVEEVAKHNGLPEPSIYTIGRSIPTLPGYYRPTKNWDVVVVHEHRLVAALEFKSQVGSFGNNFNNRAEEALGSATDLWQAFEGGAYQPKNAVMAPAQLQDQNEDPRPPFLGYLMLLEDSDKSSTAVGMSSPHFHVFSEFEGASYAKRYQLLCERLMQHQVYSAAALILSAFDQNSGSASHRHLSKATDARSLFAEFGAKVRAAMES